MGVERPGPQSAKLHTKQEVSMFLLLLALAHAGNGQARFSVAASDSLSTAASCELLTEISGTDANSRQIDDGAYMQRLDLKLTSIVTAATITVWLAKDSGGEDAITDQAAVSIVDEDADGNGSISVAVNSGWVVDADASALGPYVCAKTNAGTATSVGRLLWEKR